MEYTIFNRESELPLNAFYPNGNGEVKDILEFSARKYMFFGSKEEARGMIEYIKREVEENSKRYGEELYGKLISTIGKLEICEKEIGFKWVVK